MRQPSETKIARSITVLPVRDIGEAVAWYEQALGLKAIYLHEGDEPSEPVNYAILRRESFYVHLILDEPDPERAPWMQAGVGYLYLLVHDVDTAFAEVEASGVAIARGLATENWGARGFNLVDPSGNAVHIEQS